MYTTRRNGFDRDDARLHYAQLQNRKPKLVSVGDKVVMNDSNDAQVYTVTELRNSHDGSRIMAQLMYSNDAVTVDASLLLTPLNHS